MHFWIFRGDLLEEESYNTQYSKLLILYWFDVISYLRKQYH